MVTVTAVAVDDDDVIVTDAAVHDDNDEHEW